MFGWRRDIAILRESITDEPPESWRADLMATAQARGHNAFNWRNALSLLANDYGVIPLGWRSAIMGIAKSLGQQSSLGWRDSLRFIRIYYQNNPSEPPKPVIRYKWDDNEIWDDNGIWLDREVV